MCRDLFSNAARPPSPVLIHLRVRDYAVLDDVSVELGAGMSVLSGETGAGKSLLVDALSLLLGERATSEVVRDGNTRSVVEGVFDVRGRTELLEYLDDLGVQPDQGLVFLKREVATEGRNRAWVNGSPATAALVGELGSALVDLHGQHEHQTLLRADEQRRLLDAYAGATDLARAVAEQHAERARLLRELDAAESRRRHLAEQADFLRFQRDEIGAARLTPDADLRLEEEAKRLAHSSELAGETGSLGELLYAGEDALADQLAGALQTLRRLLRLDPTLDPTGELLESAYQQIVEAGRHLGEYAERVEFDPERLEWIRGRLDQISQLKRKYGPNLADVIETHVGVSGELEELDGTAFDLDRLRRAVDAAGERLAEAAAALTYARAVAATRLEREVGALLPELGMPEGRLEVALEPVADSSGNAPPEPGGAETVELRVTLNAGFAPRMLRKVASGGELSRVMLALKAVLAGVDRVPTLVFDEIDAGIGGAVAAAVSAKLHEVARGHQVLVVTHLPQLASRADGHLVVEKKTRGGIATTHVRALSGEQRVREVARMLGGDPESERSRDHARELLGVI